MMGGGWRHQEAEPSCGFVDESFGPAHALRAVWTARGQRARRALPTACPHSRASRPQLHRTDNHFFSQVVCTTGTHAFDPDQPIGSKSPKSLLTSDASRPIIPSSRKRHPTSTSLATRPISPSLSHWTAGPEGEHRHTTLFQFREVVSHTSSYLRAGLELPPRAMGCAKSGRVSSHKSMKYRGSQPFGTLACRISRHARSRQGTRSACGNPAPCAAAGGCGRIRAQGALARRRRR